MAAGRNFAPQKMQDNLNEIACLQDDKAQVAEFSAMLYAMWNELGPLPYQEFLRSHPGHFINPAHEMLVEEILDLENPDNFDRFSQKINWKMLLLGNTFTDFVIYASNFNRDKKYDESNLKILRKFIQKQSALKELIAKKTEDLQTLRELQGVMSAHYRPMMGVASAYHGAFMFDSPRPISRHPDEVAIQLQLTQLRSKLDPELLNIVKMTFKSLLEQQKIEQDAKQVADHKKPAENVDFEVPRDWLRVQQGFQMLHLYFPYPCEAKLKEGETEEAYFERVDYRYGKPGEPGQCDVIAGLHLLLGASDHILFARIMFLNLLVTLSMNHEQLKVTLKPLNDKSISQNPKKYSVFEALDELVVWTQRATSDSKKYIHKLAGNLKKLQTPAADAKRVESQVQSDIKNDYSRVKELILTKNFTTAFSCLLDLSKTHIPSKLHLANFYYLGLHREFSQPDVAMAIETYCSVIDDLLDSRNVDAKAVQLAQDVVQKRLEKLVIFSAKEGLSKINACREKIRQCLAHHIPDESQLRVEAEQRDADAWLRLVELYNRKADEILSQVKEKLRGEMEGVYDPKAGDPEKYKKIDVLRIVDSEDIASAITLWEKAYCLGSGEAKVSLAQYAPDKLDIKKVNPNGMTFAGRLCSLESTISTAKSKEGESARQTLEAMVREPILREPQQALHDEKESGLSISQQRYLLNRAAEALIDIYQHDKFFDFFEFNRKAHGGEQAVALGYEKTMFRTNQVFAGYLRTRLRKFNESLRPVLNPYHMYAGSAAAAAAAPAATASAAGVAAAPTPLPGGLGGRNG